MSAPPGFARFFVYEPPETYDRRWCRDLVDKISESLLRVVTTNEAVPSVLLIAPNGKVFRVTVGDTGTLTSTEVPQGDASQ
jgi:hypothetical protein